MTPIKISLGKSESFIENDVAWAMAAIGMDTAKVPLFYIYTNEGSEEQKTEAIKSVLYGINPDNCVIITDAYVSTVEFPEEKYGSIENVPVNKILERESNLLKTLGFIDINFYVQYEFKVAFIYGNENGKKIVEYLRSLQNDNQ